MHAVGTEMNCRLFERESDSMQGLMLFASRLAGALVYMPLGKGPDAVSEGPSIGC